MPKNSDGDLQKHTLNLRAGDYAVLQEHYPDIGAAVIIRRIVHKFVEQILAEGTEVKAEIQIEI